MPTMVQRVCCVLCAVCCVLTAGCASSKSMMVVAVPVCDLRTTPQTTATPGTHDPLEETQLLYGERVRVRKMQDGWAKIEALEQPEFSHNRRWQGYPGWVPEHVLVPWQAVWPPNIIVTERWAATWKDAHALSRSPWTFPLGTRLRATDMGGQLWKVELINDETVWMLAHEARSFAEVHALPVAEKRRTILRSAGLFLGDSYYWGGRTPVTRDPNLPVTGVDCSGLTNLAYRSVNIEIPRDAHEQFLRARPTKILEPADLIFLSEKDHPQKIVHVMLYAGEGALIEGPGTGQAIRRTSVEQRFGRPMDQLTPGTIVDGQTVYFGTYLP